MHWIVDKFLDQSLLNTAAWRYVYPDLYKKYPNDDMTLNVSVTSPPVIQIAEHGINVTIYLDVTVNVLDADEVIPVACVSLVCFIKCLYNVLVIFVGYLFVGFYLFLSSSSLCIIL